MSRFRFGIWCLVVVLMGCVSMQKSGVRRTSGREGITMVYGAGASSPHESDREVAEHWMTVHVTQSDSLYEFGHIDESGSFEGYCAGFEGRFRIRGGETRHFAIRDTLHEVHPLAGGGSFEFSGPAMAAARAVFPPMEDAYYSIVILTFEVARDSTVTAELVASSPNGFTASGKRN